MVSISVEYQGALRCVATHGPSQTLIETDAPVDNHGKGERFSPTDLCASALITCMATIMGIQARTIGVDLSGMTLSVEKHMSDDRPRRIARLPVTIRIPGVGDEKVRQQLIRAAGNCPVHQSLHPEIEKPIRWEWV